MKTIGLSLNIKNNLERKLLECDTKQERWHELYAEASITRNIHRQKNKRTSPKKKEKISRAVF